MASPVQCIIESQLLTGSAAALFTAPAGIYAQIVKLSCTNSDSASQTITLYLVPAGGTAGNGNVSTSGQSILAGATFNSPNEYAQVLNPGDAIWGFASTAGKVNIRASALLAS